MNFKTTKNMTNKDAPIGKVLIQYLEPSWGKWSVEFGIGYFDNPDDYEEGGKGWCLWFNDREVNVLAYCELPEKIETELIQLEQIEFREKFGSYHPNLGSIGY